MTSKEYIMRPLTSFARLVRGVTFSRADSSTEPVAGCIAILRAGNISRQLILDDDLVWVDENLVSEEQRLQQGDIAICMSSGSRAVVGKTARLDRDFAGSVGAFCAIIRPGSYLVSRLLDYYFKTVAFTDWRLQHAAGANIQNIRHSELERHEIALPDNEHEQARIVELLDQADALRHQRAKADSKLAILSPAFFRHCFGDPESNPKHYILKDFDQVFDDISAGEAKLQTKTFLPNGLLPIIDQGADQISGYTDDLSAKFTGPIPAIVFGDHTRNFKYVDHDFAIGADGVRVLSPKPGFLPEFLYWHCRLLNIPSAGYSRHMKFLKAKRFIRPTDLEQERFAQAVRAARHLNVQSAVCAARLETLFQTLLHRAFNGELTAPWREAHLREGVQELSRIS